MPLSGKQAKARVLLFGGRNDYLMEAEKLSDQKGNQEVINSKSILSKLAEMSNKMFSSLKKTGYITEKQLKYFSYEYRKATSIGKLYFIPKTRKTIHNVPGRPLISNCGTPTEKCSEFLDYHLKPLMRRGWSYIKKFG